jgi:hypothetical protein
MPFEIDDVDVARSLLAYANQCRHREFLKWIGMPTETPQEQVNLQDERVAAWARAVNALYALTEKATNREGVTL